MTDATPPAGSDDPAAADEVAATSPHLVTEDVLLLLFQPEHGLILGEDILFYVLGGAVVADLALGGWIEIDDPSFLGGRRVRAAEGEGPADPLLRPAWEKIQAKPRDVQTVLAESGPLLRAPVLDRLVERGHLRPEQKRTLGIFPSTAYREGDTGRRAELVAEVRAVLLDGADPTPRTATLIGLLSASGELVNLNAEIPWRSPGPERAFALQYGTVEGAAAGLAVARTDAAAYVAPLLGLGALGR